MKTTQANLDTARAAFEQIAANCAPLKYDLRDTPRHEWIDLEMVFNAQPGLAFDVYLNLQQDELHVNSGPYWHAHFSVRNEEVVTAFVREVTSLIKGEYRLLVSLRNDQPIKCELQRPSAEGWRTVSILSQLRLPFGTRTQRIIQNTAFDQSSPSSN